MKKVAILGAGFGGLQLSARLSEQLAGEVEVLLIDKGDAFVFGYSKLELMFGRQTLDAVRLSYTNIRKRGVNFRQETVETIDPAAKRFTTNRGEYEVDVLVIALGADLDPVATHGLLEYGNEFYSIGGASRVRDVLPSFESGDALVSVLGPFFKCPAAPYETAIMLHDYLVRHGRRDSTSIKVLTSLGAPIPISPLASEKILEACGQRDIEFWPSSVVGRLEGNTGTAHLRDGRSVHYDFFLGVPVHRAPAVVEASGLTDDGWIAVDISTFETRFPDVYAVGDVTSAPVPRVGVMAESEANIVADVLVHRFGHGPEPDPFEGKVRCYIEFGDTMVAQFDANFLGGSTPTSEFTPPSLEVAARKKEFGETRRARWFEASTTR